MLYTLPTSVEIDGISYPISTDFRVILGLIEILNDAEFSQEEKAEAVLDIFYYQGIPTNKGEALKRCFAFMDMGESHKAKKSPRLVDWERDYPYIIAPVNRVLGYESRSVDYLHWWTFLGAYMEIGGDCMFSQIVHMRDKLAQGKRLEKYEREWMRRNRDIVELPTRYTEQDTETEKYWTGGK